MKPLTLDDLKLYADTRVGAKITELSSTNIKISCNQRKGGRTPEQARMRLLSHPVKPKKLPDMDHLRVTYVKGMPEAWRTWLRDAVYWQGELEHD